MFINTTSDENYYRAFENYKLAVKEAMKKLGATNSELLLIHDATIRNAVCSVESHG